MGPWLILELEREKAVRKGSERSGTLLPVQVGSLTATISPRATVTGNEGGF